MTDKKPTDEEMIKDLGMLVRRLVRRIKQTDPNNELAQRALDYVNKYVEKPSPLRTENGNLDLSTTAGSLDTGS